MITTKDIEHIANLSRLEFTASEIESFKVEMNSIVEHMEDLNKVDTSKVDTVYHSVSAKEGLRQDEPRPFFTPQQAVQNAPDKKGGEFVVPQVLD